MDGCESRREFPADDLIRADSRLESHEHLPYQLQVAGIDVPTGNRGKPPMATTRGNPCGYHKLDSRRCHELLPVG